METIEFSVDSSRTRVLDITDELTRFCRGKGDGLASVFVPHATAGLAVIETGAGSEEDLVELLDRLVPRDHRYGHHHGTPGHGADHLIPAVVGPSLVVPVTDGVPALGTWQHVVLVDLNPDNRRRKVRLSFVAG